MLHLEMRYYLQPFFETRSVSKNGRDETLPEMCTQLRPCVHVKCVAYRGPGDASLAMRFEMLGRYLK